MLIKPMYEKPIDSLEDVIERGMKILDTPGTQDKVANLKHSPSQLVRTAATEHWVVTEVYSLLIVS